MKKILISFPDMDYINPNYAVAHMLFTYCRSYLVEMDKESLLLLVNSIKDTAYIVTHMRDSIGYILGNIKEYGTYYTYRDKDIFFNEEADEKFLQYYNDRPCVMLYISEEDLKLSYIEPKWSTYE